MRRSLSLLFASVLLMAGLVVPAPASAASLYCHAYQIKVSWSVDGGPYESEVMTAYPCTTYAGSDWKTNATVSWAIPPSGTTAVASSLPANLGAGAYYMTDGSNRIDFWVNIRQTGLCTPRGGVDMRIYARVKKARTGPGVSSQGTSVVNVFEVPLQWTWRIDYAQWI